MKSMVVSGDKLFTGYHDNKICVWKIDEGDSDDRKLMKSTFMTTLPTFNDRVAKMFSPKNYVKVLLVRFG